MPARAKPFPLDLLFRALADRTRLRLLNLIHDQEICVCYLVEIAGDSQPKISRHLAYLRRAGLIAARRDGKWMHYRLTEPAHPGAAAILRAVLASLRDDPQMQSDRIRLSRACCQPAKFVALAAAPPPIRVHSQSAETR
jgi:ArsR family transcriptional regulator